MWHRRCDDGVSMLTSVGSKVMQARQAPKAEAGAPAVGGGADDGREERMAGGWRGGERRCQSVCCI